MLSLCELENYFKFTKIFNTSIKKFGTVLEETCFVFIVVVVLVAVFLSFFSSDSCDFEIVLNIAFSESLKSLNLIFASAMATTWRTKKYIKTSSLLRAKQKKISFLEAEKGYFKSFSNYCPK